MFLCVVPRALALRPSLYCDTSLHTPRRSLFGVSEDDGVGMRGVSREEGFDDAAGFGEIRNPVSEAVQRGDLAGFARALQRDLHHVEGGLYDAGQ